MKIPLLERIHSRYGFLSLFVAFCILLNFGGKCLASALSLPIWLDSIGTVIGAYTLGPFCGAVIGLSGNILHSFLMGSSVFYGITSILIGIIIGIASQKKYCESFFGSMCVATLITIVSMLISLPISTLVTHDFGGNPWGLAVNNFLQEQGFGYARYFISSLYIEFPDKILTMIILYFTIHIYRKIYPSPKVLATLIISGALLGGIICNGSGDLSPKVQAAGKLTWNLEYSSYLQTIYDSKNGLPCGVANDIAQTTDGILWVGTYAGLYRYNGKEFKWMNNYESIKNVNCLYTDAEGRLWIGTNDGGLTICIDEEVVNVIDSNNGLPSNSVSCISGGSDGKYYVGTSSGLAVIDKDSGFHVSKCIETIQNATSITSDKNGLTAVTAENGRLYLLNEGDTMSYTDFGNSNEVFTALWFTRDNKLLAGTNINHMVTFSTAGNNLKREKTIEIPELLNINSFYTDEQSSDLFITTDSGVLVMDTKGNITKLNMNSFSNSIENMDIDYQGNLWFVSSRLGLCKFSNTGVKDIYMESGLKSKVVNTVCKWQKYVYCGTDDGLDIVNPKSHDLVKDQVYEYFEGIRVRCLRVDSSNNLWVGSYGPGATRIEPNGNITTFGSLKIFGDKVRTVLECSDMRMAVGGVGGVSFIGKNDTIDTIGPLKDKAQVLCLENGLNGECLAGTDGDGIAVIEGNKVTKFLTTGNGLSSNIILRLTKDAISGIIYVVCSNGICYIDNGGAIHTLDNFPYYNNYDILISNNDKAFVTGSSGVYVVDLDGLISGSNDVVKEIINTEWGMSSSLTANAWNDIDNNGNLYIASSVGVYAFDSEEFDLQNRTWRMSLKNVELDDKKFPIDRGSAFEIDRDINNISITPEIINYTAYEPYVSYQMLNYDTTSTTLPLNDLSTIHYTNLPAGTYTFKISILDKDKTTVVEESEYTFVKNKELQDNGYFYIYMVIVATIVVAWITWLIFRTQIQRTLRIQQHNLEIANQQIKMGNETILTIANALDSRDGSTSQHSKRVSQYSVMIAREYGFTEDECENLRKAALLHDIGKIGIPDRILNKPARLTDEEYAIMKTHVTKGGEILKNFTGVEHVVEGALYHHEKYDGTGYPQGLKGENIPLYGRIIGVADAFDAMTANRVYRGRLEISYVLNEMETCKGTQFDPELADILLKLVHEGKININKLYNEEKP